MLDHICREFVKAEKAEPDAVAEALELIGVLYRIEAHIRKIATTTKRHWRAGLSRPSRLLMPSSPGVTRNASGSTWCRATR
jgi:hypothetical protein